MTGPTALTPVRARTGLAAARVYVADTGPLALLAVTVNVDVPALLGVPLRTPLVALSCRPDGTDPLVTAKVAEGVPVDVIGNEYGVPTVAAVGAPEVMAGLLEVVGALPAAQFGDTVTVLDCRVTAAVLARSRP